MLFGAEEEAALGVSRSLPPQQDLATEERFGICFEKGPWKPSPRPPGSPTPSQGREPGLSGAGHLAASPSPGLTTQARGLPLLSPLPLPGPPPARRESSPFTIPFEKVSVWVSSLGSA